MPLFLVTMASQNLPGFAVLRASGYQPPVTSCLLTTGACLDGDGALRQPRGEHGGDHRIDGDGARCPSRIRQSAGWWPGPIWFYMWRSDWRRRVRGGAWQLCRAALITTIAGLALFSPLMGSVVAMLKEPRDIESALITFLVTASGITFYGVGSAFWGLVAGLVLFGVRHVVGRGR